MNAERADMYWKWGWRAGVALLLLLANALLALIIINASNAFNSLNSVGEAATSLKRTAVSLDLLAAEIGEDAERVTGAVEQAGTDVTRAADALEDARMDLEGAASDFGRIANTLEEAFSR